MTSQDRPDQSSNLGRLVLELAELELHRLHDKPVRLAAKSQVEVQMEQVLTKLIRSDMPQDVPPVDLPPVDLPKEETLNQLLQGVLTDLREGTPQSTATTPTQAQDEDNRISDTEMNFLTEQLLQTITHPDNSGTKPVDSAKQAAHSPNFPAGESMQWNLYGHQSQLPEPPEPWVHCFDYLNNDPCLLGWIAFRNDTPLASDRLYDEELLTAMTGYYRAALALCKILGTNLGTRFQMTSGDGDMWCVPSRNDVWFMLFATDASGLEDSLSYIPSDTSTSTKQAARSTSQ